MPHKSRSIDLNHALPELPVYQHTASHSQSSFSGHQQRQFINTRSSRSVSSSPQASSKKRLGAVTQRLLWQAEPEVMGNLHNGFDLVEPIKFSPPENSKFRTAMIAESLCQEPNQSPCHEERCTRIDDLLREYERANAQVSPNAPRSHPNDLQHKPHGMSSSLSEDNITFRRNGNQRLPTSMLPPMSPPKLIPRQSACYESASGIGGQDLEAAAFSHARGRFATRTPSPIKGLEDIKEDRTPEGTRGVKLYYNAQDDPPTTPAKRSRSPMKQLFGDKGFLGRSTSMKELPNEEYRKRGVKYLGEKFKQRVEGMTASISHGDLSKLIPSSLSNRESPPKDGCAKAISTFPVSLSPPEQAKFYSEAELMIVATANNYLIVQKDEGRMSYESVAKMMNFWTQKNRPQVIDFMFDQLTQRDLILRNLKTFRFYGPNAENPMSMNAMMNSWKTLAKEMSVRTFCTGDSTIRKQMQDLYKILELLGAPMVTFIAFQQIQLKILKNMREKQQQRDDMEAIKYGVERKWEPPGGFDSRDSGGSEAYTNPFTDS